MKNSVVEVTGRIDAKGHFVSKKRLPFSPGPAKAKVSPVKSASKTGTVENPSETLRKRWDAMIAKIDAIPAPAVPNDGRSVDEILYGARE